MPSSRCRSSSSVEDLGLDRDVERGGRLVGDQQLRLAGQRHRDHHALAQAAGQLVRVVVEPLAAGAAGRPGRALGRPLARGLARDAPAVQAHRLGDLLADRHASGSARSSGPGRPSRSRRRGPRASRARGSADQVAARRAGSLPPTMRPPGGSSRMIDSAGHRLAAAGLADEAERLAGVDVEGHAVDRVHDRAARSAISVRRSRTSSTAAAVPHAHRRLQPDFERVPQRVADEVERDHREHDRDARPGRSATSSRRRCSSARR